MTLRDVQTGEALEAVLEELKSPDFTTIKNSPQRFSSGFNRAAYRNEEIYKIRLKHGRLILGLICIKDHPDPSINAIQIELLEVCAEHIGKNKKIDRIGGCLIAYACRESFLRGREGVVFLVPKTELIEHYTTHYGFIHWPVKNSHGPAGIMYLFGEQSHRLIKEYLEE